LAASVSLSPSERSQRARIAAYAQKAKHDPKETTSKAREVFRAKFYAGIPEDRPQAERDRRAEAAFREHMARLSLLSARARRKGAAP
jgi:hypothetical protein